MRAWLGVTRDPNPNPVGLGILAVLAFWPSVLLVIVGVVQSYTRYRSSQRAAPHDIRTLSPASCLDAILPLLMALLLSGCASIWSQPYPKLRDTNVHVSWMMTDYRNMVVAGLVTLGEREQVNAAYTEYKAAFDEALQAAHNVYHAPTPENVKALAKELDYYERPGPSALPRLIARIGDRPSGG